MKKTLILFIIFLALGAFVYFYEVRGGREREEAEERKGSLLQLETDDVKWVSLIRGDEDTLIYEREESENWRIVSPVMTEAEGSAVSGNISAFSNARIERRLRTSPDKLENFGLNPPAGELIVKTLDGQTRHLIVGDEAPTRGDLFVAFEDSNEVLVTSTNVATHLKKSLFDLRDKKIAHFDDLRVRKVELTSSEGEIVMEKTGDDWLMVTPKGIPVDASRVTSFLSSMKNYSANEFVQEDFDDLEPFGFNDPSAHVTLSLGEERATKEIVVGRQSDDGESFYGYESGRSPVFLIKKTTKDGLSKSSFYFQDKKIVTFNEDEITEIRFAGMRQVTLSIEDTLGWLAYADSSIRVEESQMNRLFSNLRSLSARELVTYDPVELSDFGLREPFMEVVMSTHEGAHLKGFAVGDTVENDRYIQSRDFPFVYRTAKYQLDRFTDWLDDLTDSE